MPREAKLPPLLPTPRRAHRVPGNFRLGDGLPILLEPESDDGDFATAVALREAVQGICGIRLAIETHQRSDDLVPCVALARDGDRGEAHRIRVDSQRVELSGSGPAGLRYAVETLVQLIDPRGRIPGCRIEDAPSLTLRGVMLDISRGKVPTPAALRGLVDLCVRLKLNALMLYVEHTFVFRRHPDISAGASPLDAAAIRELDAYAAARHVELIPSLQSLGHMERILSLPAYAALDETGAGWTLSPAIPGTYDLLADLFGEFLPNFRSRRFNANCDEPYDLERGHSRDRAKELGPGGVYLEHVGRVRDLARAQGKQTLIWGDVVHAHPERIPQIDRDLVLLDWWYEADHDYDRVERFADAGLEFIVCPGTSSWNCLFPRVDNSLENIARYADAGRRHGALGLIVTDWGDGGHSNLLGNSWFAYAWAAQQAWSGDADPRDFDRAFSKRLFGDASGTAARLYRELGAVHDTGIPVFNASALQFLYFDDLDRGFFVEGHEPAAIRRSLRKLERVREKITAAEDCFQTERLTWEELCLAVDSSLLAARKATAGARYIAWRRRPEILGAAERKKLARELSQLAREQAQLARELRRLWLRRSAISNFEITRRRIDRSLASTRRAARALANNRPTEPPPPHPGFSLATVIAALSGD